jgi:hypothetical protein
MLKANCVFRRLGSCIPTWKNPSRMPGCKWGLLKGREREIQREHGGAQEESTHRESMISFSGAFKNLH